MLEIPREEQWNFDTGERIDLMLTSCQAIMVKKLPMRVDIIGVLV